MSIQLSRRSALGVSAASVAGAALPRVGWAQTATPAAATGDEALAEAVDAFVKRAMAGFPDQPAVSIALVKDGKPLLTRGYGLRKQGERRQVDQNTLFAIASNTKAVTCAGLAMLVDQNRLSWDAPVKHYLPGFTLSDPWIGEKITVRDLVSHRAGFGLGAGDLLFWPNSDRTREEIMAAVPFVPIQHGFRSRYDYCNLMFVVAGEVLATVSGMPWERFVQTRILNPLGMADTLPIMQEADPSRSALPHGRIGPPLRYQGPMQPIGKSIQEVWNWSSAAAAGGFVTTPVDWAKWIGVQLSGGVLPNGQRLWSEAQSREMWKPNIIIGSSPGPTAQLPGRAIASTYALGWQVQDYRGERMISHGGGAPGYISGTVLFPGRNVGFSYFTNAEEAITRALRGGIADIVLGKADFDWVADSARIQAEGVESAAKAAAEIDARQAAGAPPSLPLDAYVGTWRDPWYGDIVIDRRGRGLWLTFSRTPSLKGPLEPYDGNTFRTRFPDKREEDAFITFALEEGKPVSATMKAVSPDADFSYDYHDLRLSRV